MKCVFCKVGNTKPGTTGFTHDDGTHVHVIRNIPAEICDYCGEAYFDSKTSEQISRLIKKADAEGLQMGVQNFVPGAPSGAESKPASL